MAKIEMCGAEIEVGGGALFLSVPGVGELWAEIVTNPDDPRPFEVRLTETGSIVVEWGTVHMALSPSHAPASAAPL